MKNEEQLLTQSTLEKALSLVESLEGGDAKEAARLVAELSQCLEEDFVQEVGKITRDLHNTLVDLSEHKEKNLKDITDELPDAKDRLEHVVKLTEDATNKTIDVVEVCLPLGDRLALRSAQLLTEWDRLQHQEVTPKEFKMLYHGLGDFLAELKGNAEFLNKALNDVLMTQEYQDLTGQLIGHVLNLVNHVETNLVDLVSAAKGAGYNFTEKEKSTVLAEGPVVNVHKRENIVASQDDVDDLLSSLGL
ncbi:chemotaxis protein CheZ [Piscirickettsia salmonis]|uniref:Protein phosphatase CheZ n=1 Tax=Piscirickettsia salmonis TaxID=1238 RepID=A0A0K2DX32_PISSA|nr:protein phosphatase CheZ [Piscirickettsia salmonis]AKP73885.2 chemotaxis protein CheZ [Piscirickettsia salmonis LF-89 = ATCC VR-1361]ALA24899.1 chemotaxis phosphatase, CheZ family protein [Piscirickettsia salmonis]ALB22695.1 chemotaxis phosphatase, CheZ [Piscirickettsia salmonis]ALY02702.1 chemotaxis protein CheZ [Piscirickettsia salmonis]AMA42247.1 chemotaxis protein CheZ [Piscirickettsia salmonis]